VAVPPLQFIAVVTAALVKANTGGWVTDRQSCIIHPLASDTIGFIKS
jgi:hypothetical protein